MARIPKASLQRGTGFSGRRRLLTVLVATALAALLWAGWLPVLGGVTQKLEKDWQDRLKKELKPTPERNDFVFFGVDDPGGEMSALEPEEIAASPVLQAMNRPYPWSRAVWAEAIERLAEAGARLILVDIFFPGPSGDPAADEHLARVLETHREKVLIASQWTPINEWSMRHDQPYALFLGKGRGGSGFVNFWPDPVDDLVRIADFRLTPREAGGMERHEDEPEFLSFAAVAARNLGVEDIPRRGMLRLSGWPQEQAHRAGQAYPPLSLHTLFAKREWEESYGSGAFFEDKVVMLGPASPIFNDEVVTPKGKLYGAQLHLQALGCLLEASFWKEPDAGLQWLGLGVMAALGAGLARKVRSPVLVLVLTVAVGAAWVFGCAVYASQSGVLFTGFAGLLGLVVVSIGSEGTEFWFEQRERRRLHRQLRRSVSPDVADALAKAPGGYFDAARGGRRMVAVLFSDVRNFTARSESMEPEELVAQLNAYFGRMVGAVFATGGTIDKFIGDAVMASWGGLRDMEDGEMAAAAVAAAEGMQKALVELNRDWEGRGWEPFEVGVGIHLGEAVVGEIGSEERSDFTTIGDAVNVAARVEGLTKQLGVPLLVTKRVAEAAGGGMTSLGHFRVKGRAEPLEVFVPGTAGAECWVDGLGSFREGDAGPLEHLAHGDGPFAGPARFYLSWLASREGQVPAGWDGVVTLETK